MQYGVLTLVDTYPEEQPLAERYQQIIELAIHAEKVGFDFFWVGEHHGSAFYNLPDPTPLLSILADRTKELRIGPGVCQLAHHNPVLAAETYGMLDILSDGRLDMVFGRPTFMRGYHLLNQQISESAARTLEGVKIVRKLWHKGAVAPVTYEGEFHTLKEGYIQPPPQQKPHPPIFIASGTEKAAASIGRDSLNLAVLSVFASPKIFAPIVKGYCSGLESAGLPTSAGSVAAGRHVFVQETDDRAEAMFGPLFDRYVKALREELAYRPAEGLGIELPPKLQINRMARALYTDTPLKARVREQSACGSPKTVANKIIELKETLGKLDAFWSIFDIGGCSTDQIFQSMELYARQVRPHVEQATT